MMRSPVDNVDILGLSRIKKVEKETINLTNEHTLYYSGVNWDQQAKKESRYNSEQRNQPENNQTQTDKLKNNNTTFTSWRGNRNYSNWCTSGEK